MICDFCNGETKKKKVNKFHQFNDNVYLIRNVDSDVCSKCGEKYFHVRTLKEINNIISKDHKSKVEETKTIEVITI
ncbi:MAG: YgiT-type zinc finger protein [Spirochaetota bacterium]|nr:YgiT-type zinc finger protein [Spirochaetota bacterium]